MTDYLYDRTGADPDVAELEGLLGAYAHRAPLREPPAHRPRRRVTVLAGAVAAAVAIAAIWFLERGDDEGCRTHGAGFAFAVAGGPAHCGGDPATRGTLPVGAWLETSGGSIADVRVADIGSLTVYGNSRVRLVGTGATGHHLELAHGKLSARVVAPPRLFVVDTPVATAVDLGCAYELTVDDDGRTRLRVTSGAVSLEGHGLVTYAPVNTEVLAAPGRGPGTPVMLTATAVLRDAVARLDAGDGSALAAIIAASGVGDTITLWTLLSRTTGEGRAAVFSRLDALSPLPSEIRADDIRAGDATAIATWRATLARQWACPGCARTP